MPVAPVRSSFTGVLPPVAALPGLQLSDAAEVGRRGWPPPWASGGRACRSLSPIWSSRWFRAAVLVRRLAACRVPSELGLRRARGPRHAAAPVAATYPLHARHRSTNGTGIARGTNQPGGRGAQSFELVRPPTVRGPLPVAPNCG